MGKFFFPGILNLKEFLHHYFPCMRLSRRLYIRVLKIHHYESTDFYLSVIFVYSL